jgi:hypothetical protein
VSGADGITTEYVCNGWAQVDGDNTVEWQLFLSLTMLR